MHHFLSGDAGQRRARMLAERGSVTNIRLVSPVLTWPAAGAGQGNLAAVPGLPSSGRHCYCYEKYSATESTGAKLQLKPGELF